MQLTPPPTIATTTAAVHTFRVRTVQELLLRQGPERSCGDLVGALEGTDGGERPASPTRALVLDRRDGAGGVPVDAGRGRYHWTRIVVGIIVRHRHSRRRAVAKKHALELCVRQVGVVVDTAREAHEPGAVLGVTVADEVKVG